MNVFKLREIRLDSVKYSVDEVFTNVHTQGVKIYWNVDKALDKAIKRSSEE